SRLIAFISGRRRAASVSSAIVQRCAPAGGLEQARVDPALDNRRRDPGILITINEVSGLRSLA
ncbi:MAG: hypothetical protein ACREU5_10730, partial [Burkholderiales bacterium]